MKTSKKGYYGLRAAFALASHDEPLSTRVLATREAMPEDYLEKILQALRKAKIVEAKKGVSGGYVLARPAHEISIWDILRPLDGPIKIAALPKGVLPCSQVSHCQTNEVFRNLEKEIENTLSNMTLDKLLPKIKKI